MKRDERYKMKEKDKMGKIRGGEVNRKGNKIEETQILRRKRKKKFRKLTPSASNAHCQVNAFSCSVQLRPEHRCHK